MYQSTIRKGKSKDRNQAKKRELSLPDEQEGLAIAVVQSMLGNGRVKVILGSGEQSLGRICGSMRRHKSRHIISSGSLVLVSIRDFEPDKCDIVCKYSPEEVALLHRKYKEFFTPILLKAYQDLDLGVTSINQEDEDVVAFEEPGPEDENRLPVDTDTDDEEEEEELDIDAI